MLARKPRLAIPLVQAPISGVRQRPSLVRLGLSHTTSAKGNALGLALAWHKAQSGIKPADYVVDESELYRCFDEKRSISPSGKDSLFVMICASPTHNIEDWAAPDRAHAVDLAAKLVADILGAYHIPIRFLSPAELSRWEKWHRPRRGGIDDEIMGTWPKEDFLSAVRAYSR